MWGIKKTGRKEHWSRREWNKKEIEEWAETKLWARKDTMCPDTTCVIPESSLLWRWWILLQNGVKAFWQNKWQNKCFINSFNKQFHWKNQKPIPDRNSGTYLRLIQWFRERKGSSSVTNFEAHNRTAIKYSYGVQSSVIFLAFLCCLKALALLGCEQSASLLYVSLHKRSRYLSLTHLSDDQSCLPNVQETYW